MAKGTPLNPGELRRLISTYKDGLSIPKLMTRFKISHEQIIQYLRANGVKIRPRNSQLASVYEEDY